MNFKNYINGLSTRVFQLLVVLLCLFQQFSIAAPIADNTLSRILKMPLDSNKVMAFIKQGWANASNHPKKYVRYADLALLSAKQMKWQRGEAEALLLKGKCLDYLGDYREALPVDFKALAKSILVKDTVLIARSLRQVGGMYQATGSYDKAIYYLSKSYDLSVKVNYLKGVASALSDLGIVYNYKLNFKLALRCFLKSIAIKYKIKDFKNVVTSYRYLSGIYYANSDYEKALDYLQKGLSISYRIGDNLGASNCIGKMGELYAEIGSNEKALVFLQKSLFLNIKIGNKQAVGIDYANLGRVYGKLNRIQESIFYLKKAYLILRQIDDVENLKYTSDKLAEVFLSICEYDSAECYYSRVLETDFLMQNRISQISNMINLANISLLKNNLKKSEELLIQAKKLFSKTEYFTYLSRDFYEIESKLLEKKGQYKASLKAYKNYILLRDSIINQDKKTAIALKEAKFEFDKKMLEDSLRNREQQKAKDLQITLQNSEIKTQKIKQNAMLAGIAVLVVFAWLLFSRLKAVSLQRKTEKQLLLLEKEQALVEERTRIADEMHDDVGADLSNLLLKIRLNEQLQKSTETVDLGTLKNTTNTIIHKIDEIIWSLNAQRDTLKELVDFIVKYYDNLMREHHLKGTVVLPENLPEQALSAKLRRNIFLCTKEILNNTLKHAQANTVNLNFAYANNQIEIGISDNGKGFDAEKSYSGNGLKNLNKRIENLNGKLEINSTSSNGTSVVSTIPLT